MCVCVCVCVCVLYSAVLKICMFPHRSELIWQLRANNSSNFKTVPEDIRQRLELAYQSEPKAIVKDDSTNLHVGLEVYSVCILICVSN